MSRNVCVLTQAEVEGLSRGIKPNCFRHSHMPKRRADVLTMSVIHKDEQVPPIARYIGKGQIVLLPGQRTWRVVTIDGGFRQMQYVR
jgi:hypothetical protein